MLVRSTSSLQHALSGDGLRAQVTPQSAWLSRRDWLLGTGALAASAWAPQTYAAAYSGVRPLASVASREAGARVKTDVTAEKYATSYNNFYEFGLGKADPEKAAQAMSIAPWSLRVEGLVAKPKTWAIEDLLKLAPIEERIYRFRCVEAWSMVVPWLGYSLSKVIQASQPLGSAKYVAFVSLMDEKVMTGLSFGGLDWPYQEGLRLDEAMHPLTMLTMGMYGQTLPKQNGAPVRLIVPWKYGFKSAKSVVTIRLTETMPATAWNRAAPNEYGFYSNVNPQVDHPRWSQASERGLGGGLFAKREPTRMMNGYAEQVASLYAGMDLRRNF
jgi:methionine sulfoxide reductase catalytic subunit